MITTVTLNPAIDRMYFMPGFNLYKLHRLDESSQVQMSPGGKGVNISISLQKLGIGSIALGFAGGYTGRILTDELRNTGVTTNFIFVEQETRSDISILDTNTNKLTEINEPGPYISLEDISFFMESYKKILTQTKLLVIGGSLPPGLPNTFYAELIQAAQEKKVPVCMHTSPKYLEAVVKTGAYLINPDLRSFHELLGRTVDSLEAFIDAGKEIIKASKKTELVLFSHRLENMVAVTPKKIFILRPQALKIVNMFGYCDAVLAGFTYAKNQKMDLKQALIYAAAAGLTNAEKIEKHINNVVEIEKNLARIKVEERPC